MTGFSKLRLFRNKYKLYIAAGITAWVIFLFLHPVGISGNAMSPTLEDGQVVIISKINYAHKEPSLYQIVDFNRDFADEGGNNANEVRRIVGLPGDTIEIRDGIVYRNGEASENDYAKAEKGENCEPVTLAEGEIYVLGDNPAESIDSREVGPLQAKDLRGDCVFVVWPLRDWGVVAQPE